MDKCQEPSTWSNCPEADVKQQKGEVTDQVQYLCLRKYFKNGDMHCVEQHFNEKFRVFFQIYLFLKHHMNGLFCLFVCGFSCLGVHCVLG